MAAPMGPPGRRLRCDECGRRGHTARSHEPGGILYVAAAPQAGPDLLTELAEVERTPAQLLADAVESVRTSDVVEALCEAVSDAGRSCVLLTGHGPVELGPGSSLNAFADHRSDAGPFWEPGNGPAVRTAQQLADAETAARRLDQVHRFITPAGEIKTLQGADVTPERVQRMCTDGAWSRNPDDGTWSCAECGKPAAAPVLAEIEALQDDAPGQLVEVDLPPLQPRARWEIEGASSEVPKPEVPQVNLIELMVGVDALHAERWAAGWPSGEAPACSDGGDCGCPPEAVRLCPGRDPDDLTDDDPGPAFPGADCDCLGDGDLHPPGSGGCVATEADGPGAVPEQLDTRRPVETVASAVVDHLLGDDPEPRETGLQHGPEAFGPPWATSAGPLARPRITLPGVYHLTDLEYHDPRVTGAWVSNSDLKAMSLPGCPAKWKFKRDNGIRDDRDVFQFGKAAHAEVLGVGAGIAVRPAEWSDWRKAAARAWKAEQQAAGLVVVTPEEAEVVLAMAEAMRANRTAVELLGRPGRAEVALFWIDRLPSGRMVQRRAMLDFLPDYGPIVDYKTCDVAAPDEQMQRAISRFRYHRQIATYSDGVSALGLGADPDVVLLFQEKTAPYLVTPVNLDDPTLLAAEIQNRQALEVYVDCLESGVWPGYADGTVTMSVPEWELREYEMEMK